jgi:hypothetical protein
LTVQVKNEGLLADEGSYYFNCLVERRHSFILTGDVVADQVNELHDEPLLVEELL